MILAQTTQHLFLIYDGARYHTSASTQAFLAAHSERITEHPLPLYSPDYNPIEFLWRKTKKRATYNKYFKEFAAVVVSAFTSRTPVSCARAHFSDGILASQKP